MVVESPLAAQPSAPHPVLNRRHWCLGTAAALGVAACSTPELGPDTPPSAVRGNIVPFSASSQLGGLPDGWRLHINRPDLPRTPLPFATLACVWDGQAPPESVFGYLRSGRIRSLVVESGQAGVLTDSDDLKIRLEAWFGDLAFS